jgi:polyisoprenyl-teichoic acid--peptidoglycan teichoic acid transferase
MPSERTRSKRKKKKKWPKIVGIVILLLLIAGGGYLYSVYHSLTSAVDTMHSPIDRDKSDKRTEKVALGKKQPFSVLMLGVDERKGDRGRSDTMIVLAVNPDTNSVKMLSIPRDTRTEIVGHGTTDKINHAYAFGGVKMAMDTAENFLDIPIDYYMKINMEGFKDIVDAVGGITVNNDRDFSYGGVHFPTGEITLTGEKALLYSRSRHEDGRGDFGRQLRQREIIQQVMKEGASVSTLTNYGSIFDALSKNVKTNLTFDEMVAIQQNYKDAAKSVDQTTIEETGKRINGIYYGIVSDQEKQRIQSMMKTQLELN